MKKLVLLYATAAAVAFCASSAKAYTIIGSTSDFSVLSVSITATTNTSEIYKGGGDYVYEIKSQSFNTAQLLQLFEGSDWAGETFPSGSKLVVGWDWSGHVLVIDSHNNVIFDASDGPNYPDSYFTVDFNQNDGPYSENYLETDPGHYDYTYQTTASFTFYDEISNYIYLFGSGPGTYTVNQNWDSHGNYSTYSNSESMNASGASSSEYMNDDDYTAVNAKITASGHGNGEDILY